MQRLSGAVLVVLTALPLRAAADCAGGWEARTPMSVPRQEIGVAAIGTRLYTIGGFDAGAATAVSEVYDATTDRWSPIASLPAPRHHPGAAAVGGALYIIGGLGNPGFTARDTVLRYDPSLDAWEPRASLSAPRGAMGVAVIDGRIYAAGGIRGDTSIADFAVYDPSLDTWTGLPPMPTARDHLAAAAIDGVFYAVGGRAGGQLFGALETFDPAIGTWQTRSPLPTPRGGLMAAALDGRLFTFGGEGNPRNPFRVFPETEAYDVGTNEWTTLDPMPIPRHGTVAAVIDGVIYVPGGAAREGFGVSGVNHTFVPPATAPILLRRPRLWGTRLQARGRIDTPAADLAAVPVVLRLTDDAGTELASLSLPPGGLVGRGRRLRYRAPRGSRGPRGLVRLVVHRARSGSLRLRVGVLLSAGSSKPTGITLTMSLGDTLHCGDVRLKRARG